MAFLRNQSSLCISSTRPYSSVVFVSMSSPLSAISSSSRQDPHLGFPSTECAFFASITCISLTISLCRKLEIALRKASEKAVEREGQMRDIEVCLFRVSKDFLLNVFQRRRYLAISLNFVPSIVTCSRRCIISGSVTQLVSSIILKDSCSCQLNSKRVDRASNVQVPRIEEELDESMDTLVKLGAELPMIQSQVNCIADVYLSGHKTVRNFL
jgi:hypothetical protein